MRILEKYDGTKTYMYPNGEIATPESVFEKFPAARDFAHIVETDAGREVMFALMNLSAIRSSNNIDPALNEADAIAAIQEIINAPPPEPEPEISANERIAAALEFQNVLGILSVTEE